MVGFVRRLGLVLLLAFGIGYVPANTAWDVLTASVVGAFLWSTALSNSSGNPSEEVVPGLFP